MRRKQEIGEMTVKGMIQVAVSLLHLSLFCQPPPPLYTYLSVVCKSLKVIIRKDVFWWYVSKGNSLRLRQYSSILFAAATDPVLEVCSTTRALVESGNFNCPSRPGHTGWVESGGQVSLEVKREVQVATCWGREALEWLWHSTAAGV